MDGPFYVTLHVGKSAIAWDLQSGEPDGMSVRIASGEGFTYAAACYQAGTALQERYDRNYQRRE